MSNDASAVSFLVTVVSLGDCSAGIRVGLGYREFVPQPSPNRANLIGRRFKGLILGDAFPGFERETVVGSV